MDIVEILKAANELGIGAVDVVLCFVIYRQQALIRYLIDKGNVNT